MCVLDGCIFAAGGGDADGDELSSVEKYDPPTDSWSAVAPMHHARVSHAMAVLDGHIYVAGGYGAEDSVEMYDAATDSWSSVADMVHKRSDFGLCVVSGRLTAVGGGSQIQSVEQYDAAADAWSVVPAMQMPTARRHAAWCICD
jgi:N-acetylneuraminic acid mutarotase